MLRTQGTRITVQKGLKLISHSLAFRIVTMQVVLSRKQNRNQRTAWYSVDSHSGGAWFECRPGYRLSWLEIFVVYFSHPGKYQRNISIEPLPLPLKPFVIRISSCHSMLYGLASDSVVKWPTKKDITIKRHIKYTVALPCRQGWCSREIEEPYSGRACFRSRPRYRQFWVRFLLVFLRSSMQMYLD
jgi:hypothetical protein